MSVPNTFASATTAIPLSNLDADFAYYDAAFQITGGAMEVNYTFRLEDPTDNTKKAEFVMSGITTGTTRQYTMPNVTGALATLGNLAQTFTGTTAFVPATAGAALMIGSTNGTGAITLGQSTAAQTVDIAKGATATATIKTVNIGTAGLSGSTTNINFGSAVAGATTNITFSGGTANGVTYLNGSKVLTSGTALTFDGTNFTTTGGITGKRLDASFAGQATVFVTDTTGAASQFAISAQTGTPSWLGTTTNTALAFYTNSTEKMRLDTSGNLGLGVTPSAWSRGKNIEIGWAGNAVMSPTSASTALSQNAYFATSWKYGQSSIATALYEIASGTHTWFNAPSGTAGTAITFTQAMTLHASGGLSVGNTTDPGVNQIALATGGFSGGVGLSGASGIGNIALGHASGTASGQTYAYFTYNGSAIGSITQSGTTAVLYNVTSDQRLKENIVDAPEFGSVIDSIKVRSYDWKTDQTHQRAGFVAQELVTVAPEAVHQPADPEEMMAVDYSKLVPMLVKEIQSLRARVAQLESK